MKNIKNRIGKNYRNLITYFLNACSNNFCLGTYFQNKLINQIKFYSQNSLFLWLNQLIN